MSTDDRINEEPQLAPPQLLAAVQPRLVAGLAAAVAFAAGLAFYSIDPKADASAAPTSPTQLANGPVTKISKFDPSALGAAITTLNLSEAEKDRIKHDIRSGDLQIGWLVLVDSMDPDGDIVSIESASWTQQVVLNKAWTPVPVPFYAGAPVVIVGRKDGGGGGITVGIATKGAPITLPILAPGDRTEVVP